jgi:ATP-dependent Lon protease
MNPDSDFGIQKVFGFIFRVTLERYSDDFDLKRRKSWIRSFWVRKGKRMIETLAVLLRNDMKSFIGPPGVGKTSIGRSVAEALGRIPWSLRDESEIEA